MHFRIGHGTLHDMIYVFYINCGKYFVYLINFKVNCTLVGKVGF